MSTLYLGTDAVALAGRLAEHLDEQATRRRSVRAGHHRRAQSLSRQMAQTVARPAARHRHQSAIRLPRIDAVEAVARGGSAATHDPLPELVDDESYELLVLSCLWHDDEPDLAPLQRYFSRGTDPGRTGCRRAWRLAQRLGSLVRDYEYHRQDQLIQPWLKNQLGMREAGPGLQELERAQKAIFRAIVAEQTGRRARLGEALGKSLRTLPQYAMEVMELPDTRKLPGRTVHVFGYTGVSMLHMQTLRWLGSRVDLRLYHLNPMVAQLDASPTPSCLDKVRQSFTSEAEIAGPVALLRNWGRAGAESLSIMGQLLTDGSRFSR